ncbi:virulence factor [Massilia glaciei]|uniref:Virulence factor n=1 Tax=Massilia glaciei TaxID=1524097 RepID=A0A2U2HF50_9BURK|nr:virulence factor [Massilia glaciei]PWF42682.1 virulence factor [Massilia glaciei]
MKKFIATRTSRLGWTFLAFAIAVGLACFFSWRADSSTSRILTNGELMTRFLLIPAFFAGIVLTTLTYGASSSTPATAASTRIVSAPEKPLKAQVVGVQWLNPLQRRDYPTEWQLLWTLGMVKPNKDDDMVRANPEKYSKLQAIGIISSGDNGRDSVAGFHNKYVLEMLTLFHDIYYTSSTYFYNVASNDDKKTWRELAGIHVEYALPTDRIDPIVAAESVRDGIISTFGIGNTSMPEVWTRATSPIVHVTMGGANAGFTSLSAGLNHLKSHPEETVWVMNWDAPSFPQKYKQINENMVLLVLAGPDYKTEREPLAWLGYPASKKLDDYEAKKGLPARAVQAWKATIEAAAFNAGKQDSDIGYVIHDANNTHPASSDRLAILAQTLTTELVEFDFMKQTFNTPALLGEMGAGTALTNVALGIAYANHIGKHVLVAGTSDAAEPTAVLVVPPAKVRPIDAYEPWFRARGSNNAYLPWWGLRHDAKPQSQGYSK